ncbi:MAG: hypothetical protein WC022_01430 [Parcubacteria group bacterium]
MTAKKTKGEKKRLRKEEETWQIAISDTWKDRVRKEVLPKILETDIPLFSADFIPGQVCIIHLPIPVYLSAASWKSKIANLQVSIAYIEETLDRKDLTRENVLSRLVIEKCSVAKDKSQKFPSGGGFVEAHWGDIIMGISFCPKEAAGSTYNGTAFHEVYHCC